MGGGWSVVGALATGEHKLSKCYGFPFWRGLRATITNVTGAIWRLLAGCAVTVSVPSFLFPLPPTLGPWGKSGYGVDPSLDGPQPINSSVDLDGPPGSRPRRPGPVIQVTAPCKLQQPSHILARADLRYHSGAGHLLLRTPRPAEPRYSYARNVPDMRSTMRGTMYATHPPMGN